LKAGIAQWVGAGYREVCGESPPNGHRFWRFWLRGQQKDYFTCGLLRDSCDGIGRPYPFTVMGTGPVAGWEQHSSLLAASCEVSWRSMEQLAAQAFKDVASLERSLASLKPPRNDWDTLQQEILPTTGGVVSLAGLPTEAGIDDQGRIVCPISEMNSLESQLANFVTKNIDESPDFNPAIFIGGLLEFPLLVIYTRSLKKEDCKLLWSIQPS
jgi:hypothetical protein